MLPLAHIGITLAIFYATTIIFPNIRRYINYWYVVVGSLLPDIIDKLIGRLLFEHIFASGRIFGHTLLFVIILTITGIYFFRKRKDARILILAGGSFIHLLLDRMWETPQTFLWPLFGWEFPRGTTTYRSFPDYLSALYSFDLGTMTYTLTTELLGIILLISFIIIKLYNKN